MKPPITISVSADAVAWYAAIVSTGLLIIEFLRFWRERVNLVLKCKANCRLYGTATTWPYRADKDYIIITVINKGKRPVTIQNVGYVPKNKKDKSGILHDSLARGSRELTEGKSTDYLLQQDLVDLTKVKYFVAYDLTGRMYKGKLEAT